uniref:Glyco_18 domain-containing protein n=2 Tax=Bursaphelenchus xylophilus TaxID=6326 RepID=A0A1I7SAQ9_BURXY
MNSLVVYILLAEAALLSADPIRGCYLTNWAQYRPEPGKWSFDRYEVGACTHIFYAFAQTDTSGVASSTDASDLTNGYAGLKALKKKQAGLKTILSFGGSSFGNFPTVAASEESRQTFAKNVVAFAKQYGFDGVDIDWEFPTADQKDLFTQLVQAVKTAGGGDFLVTAAVTANADTAAQIYDFASLQKSLDFLNIMAYDFHGTWETVTGENAPLYGSGKFTVDYITQYYNKHFPAAKILLGIPTYGRGWTLASSSPNQGPGSAALSASPAMATTQTQGILSYYEACQVIQQGGVSSWDNTSQVPYVQQSNLWYSYDNQKSVSLKATYAKSNGLAGVFVWTLDFDDFENVCKEGKLPLLNSIKSALT